MYDTEFQYFFSTATVKPRSDKYVVALTADGQGKHVLQLEATVEVDDAMLSPPLTSASAS